VRHSLMCTEVVDLLEPLHDGELDIAEQVRVENHLEVCAACHATARELREVREMMSAALVRTPRLEVPHPRMHERRFVLVPFADLAPDVRHPVTRMTIREMRDALPEHEMVQPWKPLS